LLPTYLQALRDGQSRQEAYESILAAELAARTEAELCGLVGRMAILYRRHPDSPKIEIPTAPGDSSRE
jgi:RNA-binding protein YhbY